MKARLLRALELLEVWLASREYPGVAGLQPGISESEVRGRLGALGLDPTDDIVTFFGWHNGWDQEPIDGHWYAHITPSWFPLTLDEACKEFVDLREDFVLQEEHGELVGTLWFPLLRGDAFFIVVDCRLDPEHRGRIAVRDWACELSPTPDRRLDDLAEVVEEWLTLLNDGLWQWSQSGGWTDIRDHTARWDPIRGIDRPWA